MAQTTLIVTGGPAETRPVMTYFDGPSLHDKTVLPVRPESESARRLVGCGAVLPDENVIIVDPDSRKILSADSIGEIWIQSPSVGSVYPPRSFLARMARACSSSAM